MMESRETQQINNSNKRKAAQRKPRTKIKNKNSQKFKRQDTAESLLLIKRI